MSLVINEEKVRELTVAIRGKGYVVSASPLETRTENYAPLYSTYEMSGTDAACNFEAASRESRRQLMAIRKKIEESGVPLHDIGSLTEEIDGIRGRTR